MGVSEQLRTILSITLYRPHLQWGVDQSSLSNFIPHVSCQMGLITRFTHYVLLILNGLSLSHTLGTSRQLGFQLNQVTSIPLISITLFEIFIFRPKIQLWFPEKIVDFFGVENSWKCWGFVKIEFLDKNLTFRIVCIIPIFMDFCRI